MPSPLSVSTAILKNVIYGWNQVSFSMFALIIANPFHFITMERYLFNWTEIEEKLVTVTDYDELEHYWTAWHDAMSKAVKPSEFTRFVQLQNEMAKANGEHLQWTDSMEILSLMYIYTVEYTVDSLGFNDMSEMWLEPYNDGTAGWTAANFKRLMLDTWEELKPFYRKLHAYVRMKLRQYPNYEARIKKYGYLPSNLMGNMWAQDWAALENRTKPFPNVPSLDATEAMKRKVSD